MSEVEKSETTASFDAFVAAFPNEGGGERALKQLKKVKKEGKVRYSVTADLFYYYCSKKLTSCC